MICVPSPNFLCVNIDTMLGMWRVAQDSYQVISSYGAADNLGNNHIHWVGINCMDGQWSLFHKIFTFNVVSLCQTKSEYPSTTCQHVNIELKQTWALKHPNFMIFSKFYLSKINLPYKSQVLLFSDSIKIVDKHRNKIT